MRPSSLHIQPATSRLNRRASYFAPRIHSSANVASQHGRILNDSGHLRGVPGWHETCSAVRIVSIIPCPCGDRGCLAILRDGNVYEEGFNLAREIHDPEPLLDYGRKLAEAGRLAPTSDDWAPTFPGGFVVVTVRGLATGEWRVSVWGGDDDGMSKGFASKEDADRCFARLPVYIAKDDLLAIGFERA